MAWRAIPDTSKQAVLSVVALGLKGDIEGAYCGPPHEVTHAEVLVFMTVLGRERAARLVTHLRAGGKNPTSLVQRIMNHSKKISSKCKSLGGIVEWYLASPISTFPVLTVTEQCQRYLQ
jgi:hypothetical protein